MKPEKILYTDGHDVIITETSFQVKNKMYNLEGITRHELQTIRPNRAPAIFLFVLGLIIMIAGVLKMISPSLIPDVKMGGDYISANTLAVWSGLILAIIGLLITLALKERYSVRISTAEGEKDAVVSRQKEYIRQIVNALNEAYNFWRMNMNPGMPSSQAGHV
jgi:hypothetical protein